MKLRSFASYLVRLPGRVLSGARVRSNLLLGKVILVATVWRVGGGGTAHWLE